MLANVSPDGKWLHRPWTPVRTEASQVLYQPFGGWGGGLGVYSSSILTHSVKYSTTAVSQRIPVRSWYNSGRAGSFKAWQMSRRHRFIKSSTWSIILRAFQVVLETIYIIIKVTMGCITILLYVTNCYCRCCVITQLAMKY